MHINWKKTIIVTLDVVLGIYVAVAMTTFNSAEAESSVCTKVTIDISDGNTNGFLSSNEIKAILQRHNLYPLSWKMSSVTPRKIEDLLKVSPFVKTAECYKTVDGHVNIVVTQRMPIVRIKSDNNGDYYLDEKGGIMPNSKYTSDLIIATGNINKTFATNYVAYLAGALMENDMWRNLVEQINVLPDKAIEIVPRVGDHIVNIGYLPYHHNKTERQDSIVSYVNRQMNRLEKFYKYGLSQAGWNKYSYINLEFSNQIICKKKSASHPIVSQPEPVVQKETTSGEATASAPTSTKEENNQKKENQNDAKKSSDTNKFEEKEKTSSTKKSTDTKKTKEVKQYKN